MTIFITNPVLQTEIFTALFVVTFFFFSRRQLAPIKLSVPVTQELKGFAILSILFAHIGYYLAQDARFLFPFSVLAGVSVDLFLFLSGYGIAYSMIQKKTRIGEFYARRFSRIFIPFWIVFGTLLLLDHTFFNLHYPLETLLQNILGFFPKADLYTSLNAPFWYLTLLLFYYLLFPLFYWKKAPLLSATILAIIGYKLTRLSLPIDSDLLKIYQTHLLAFPIGLFSAASSLQYKAWIDRLSQLLHTFFEDKGSLSLLLRSGVTLFLALLASYFAIHSAVGMGVWREQFVSLLTMACLIGVFLFKPFENRFLALVGAYSYEIYLIHWPILYRYDPFYPLFPAGIVTFFYVFFLLGIGVLLQKTSKWILSFNVKDFLLSTLSSITLCARCLLSCMRTKTNGTCNKKNHIPHLIGPAKISDDRSDCPIDI